MEMSLNPRGCAAFADATLICLSADWWKQLRRSRRDTFKTLLWLTKIYGRHFLNCSSEEGIFHTRIPQRCTLSYVTLFDAMNLEKCHCNSLPVERRYFSMKWNNNFGFLLLVMRNYSNITDKFEYFLLLSAFNIFGAWSTIILYEIRYFYSFRKL